MFYTPGLQTGHDNVAQSRANRAESVAQESRAEARELRDQVERLALLNQALWELVRNRLHLSDADLERLAQEIDLRDGKQDGRISKVAVRCPQCQRVNNSRHKRCIYCTTEFASMVFE